VKRKRHKSSLTRFVKHSMADSCKKCEWAARKHGYWYKPAPKAKTLADALAFQVHAHQVKGKLIMSYT